MQHIIFSSSSRAVYQGVLCCILNKLFSFCNKCRVFIREKCIFCFNVFVVRTVFYDMGFQHGPSLGSVVVCNRSCNVCRTQLCQRRLSHRQCICLLHTGNALMTNDQDRVVFTIRQPSESSSLKPPYILGPMRTPIAMPSYETGVVENGYWKDCYMMLSVTCW